MSLEEIERKELVKFRLEKAHDTFAEIPILIENKFYRTAANRFIMLVTMRQPPYLSMTVMKLIHIKT